MLKVPGVRLLFLDSPRLLSRRQTMGIILIDGSASPIKYTTCSIASPSSISSHFPVNLCDVTCFTFPRVRLLTCLSRLMLPLYVTTSGPTLPTTMFAARSSVLNCMRNI